MEAHFDWLAKHGRRGVVLNGRQGVERDGPLPRDRGKHLVVGSARMGGFVPVGFVPVGKPQRGLGRRDGRGRLGRAEP